MSFVQGTPLPGEEDTGVQRVAFVFIHLSNAREIERMPTDRQVTEASRIMARLLTNYAPRELST